MAEMFSFPAQKIASEEGPKKPLSSPNMGFVGLPLQFTFIFPLSFSYIYLFLPVSKVNHLAMDLAPFLHQNPCQPKSRYNWATFGQFSGATLGRSGATPKLF